MIGIQPELWGDAPQRALEFYHAAIGARVLHLVDEGYDIAAQLGLGEAAFWLAP